MTEIQVSDVKLTQALLGQSLGELLDNREKLVKQVQQASLQVQTGLDHLQKFDAMIALIQVATGDDNLLSATTAQVGANAAIASPPAGQAETAPQLTAAPAATGTAADSTGGVESPVAQTVGPSAEASASDAAGAAPAGVANS